MKIKPIFLVMLVCLLTLSFVFVGCKTDDDDTTTTTTGLTFPTEFQSVWEKSSATITISTSSFRFLDTPDDITFNLIKVDGDVYTIKGINGGVSPTERPTTMKIESGNLVISGFGGSTGLNGTWTPQ